MANIRIKDLPTEATPTASENLAIDGASTRKSTIQNVVDAGAPVASQAQAVSGIDNNARMTPLTTKQSISSEVGVTVASQANGVLASTAVQPSRQIIAGSGLVGGGSLSSDVTLNVGAGTGISVLADSIGLDSTTQSRLMPSGGTSSQVLQKNSGSDYDVSWVNISSTTSVSYAPQTLTTAEKVQARQNIGALISSFTIGSAIPLAGLSNVTLSLPSGYRSFSAILTNVNASVSTSVFLRTSVDGGATFASGATDYESSSLQQVGSTVVGGSSLTNLIGITSGMVATSPKMSGRIEIYPGSSVSWPSVSGVTQFRDSTPANRMYIVNGRRIFDAEINAIQISCLSGTFTSGELRLFGNV